jgi:hypothetical protein
MQKRFSGQCQSASCALNTDRHLLIGFLPFRACAKGMNACSCPTSDEDAFYEGLYSQNVSGLVFVETGTGHALSSQANHKILLTCSLPQ